MGGGWCCVRILNYYILVVSLYHSGIQLSTHVCPLHVNNDLHRPEGDHGFDDVNT